MATVTRSAVLDARAAALVLEPRDGVVQERATGEHRFEAVEGPVERYVRSVTVTPLGDGRARVEQVVTFRAAIPFWRWLFFLPMRSWFGALGPRPSRYPWWSPPDRLDRRGATTLGVLALAAVIAGYEAGLLSQTITFAADDFGVGKTAQGVGLAFVRGDILLALPLVAGTDRRGRRPLVTTGLAVATVLTAAAALAPGLPWLVAAQMPARGVLTAVIITIGVMAAEEVPAGARAYAVGILAMAGALGVGLAVLALPLADAASWGWRLLFVLSLVALPLVRVAAPLLAETRRFRRPHADVDFAGHGTRFWLLAVSALLLAVFTAPAAQFQNEFLRDERGYTAAGISLFTILTNTPGAIGIVVGGWLADVRGRRPVGAVALVVGVGATVLMYATSGVPMWAWSTIGSVVGAAFVPALGVYGPELFPTSLRGRANGVIAGLGRIGSVAGLITVGVVGDHIGVPRALAYLSVGPALVALLILVAYPETARRELEELNPEDAQATDPSDR